MWFLFIVNLAKFYPIVFSVTVLLSKKNTFIVQNISLIVYEYEMFLLFLIKLLFRQFQLYINATPLSRQLFFFLASEWYIFRVFIFALTTVNFGLLQLRIETISISVSLQTSWRSEITIFALDRYCIGKDFISWNYFFRILLKRSRECLVITFEKK